MRSKRDNECYSETTVNLRERQCRFPSLSGFTLLELLLIVLIISVILGLSLPFIKKNVNSASFKTFINKNYLFLDYAKTHSVLKGKILKVKINLEEKKIVLWEMKSKNEEGDKLLEIEIPGNISVESEKENISFFPDGTIEEFGIIFSDDEARFSMIYSKSNENKIIREDDKSKVSRDR